MLKKNKKLTSITWRTRENFGSGPTLFETYNKASRNEPVMYNYYYHISLVCFIICDLKSYLPQFSLCILYAYVIWVAEKIKRIYVVLDKLADKRKVFFFSCLLMAREMVRLGATAADDRFKLLHVYVYNVRVRLYTCSRHVRMFYTRLVKSSKRFLFLSLFTIYLLYFRSQ